MDFLAATALVFVFEGLLFAAFPAASRRVMSTTVAMHDSQLRTVGLISAVVGLLALGVVRYLLG
jgi:uncharacterized protein YjeT (DUF2065 family)